MLYDNTLGRKAFTAFNYTFLILLALLCVFPLIHVLALSLSSSGEAAAGRVKLWPVDLTASSYWYVLDKPEFVRAFMITLKRVALGTAVNMFLTVLTAYPLSKETTAFRWRTFYAWFFMLTILFSGGLIPWYIIIKQTRLLDTIWALVLPTAVPVFNVILLLNFFRGLPKELEDAAFIDGAEHWTLLWRIYVPLSKPALATIALFTVVFHWNSWFDGLILMNSPENYPLQSYLQTIVIQRDFSALSEAELQTLTEISDRTLKAAQIFLAALPILVVYPFLQRYFVKGIVLGSVKG